MHHPPDCEVRETERVSNIFLSPEHDGPLVGKRTSCFKMNSERGSSEALAAQLESAHQQEAMQTETDRGPHRSLPAFFRSLFLLFFSGSLTSKYDFFLKNVITLTYLGHSSGGTRVCCHAGVMEVRGQVASRAPRSTLGHTGRQA